MNQKNTLIVMITVMMVFLTGCAATPATAQSNNHSFANNGVVTAVNAMDPHSTMPTCAQPTPELTTHCTALEQAILAVTVRLEFYRWREGSADQPREHIDTGISHATVMDGRYLVTHNHFYIDLHGPTSGESIRFSIYRANGELLVMDMPLTAFAVVMANSQTLLLDFQEYAGKGFFDVIGMPSATFAAGNPLGLRPGMEVAQVDWDGTSTHVDWVQVGDVLYSHDTPQIELANAVAPGASGGGIFWRGTHIGNNWQLVIEYHQNSDQIYRQYSVAALDSWPMLTAVGQQTAVANLN